MVSLTDVGTEDTPVWMVAKSPGGMKYEPALVAWYNVAEKEFLTRRTFSTREDAQNWLDEFWQAIWTLF